MKTFFLLLVSLLSLLELHSQNCKALDSATFFHSIKFGEQVPLDLFTVCTKGSKINDEYILSYDSLSQSCKKKYADMFTFYTSAFSNLIIRTNKKGEMYFACLWSALPVADSADLADLILSRKFKSIHKRLTSLFGKETMVKDENDLVLNTKKLTWECNDIRLELRVTYGASIQALNVMSFYIINRNFETMEQIESL